MMHGQRNIKFTNKFTWKLKKNIIAFPHFTCFICIWEQTTIILLHSSPWLNLVGVSLLLGKTEYLSIR